MATALANDTTPTRGHATTLLSLLKVPTHYTALADDTAPTPTLTQEPATTNGNKRRHTEDTEIHTSTAEDICTPANCAIRVHLFKRLIAHLSEDEQIKAWYYRMKAKTFKDLQRKRDLRAARISHPETVTTATITTTASTSSNSSDVAELSDDSTLIIAEEAHPVHTIVARPTTPSKDVIDRIQELARVSDTGTRTQLILQLCAHTDFLRLDSSAFKLQQAAGKFTVFDTDLVRRMRRNFNQTKLRKT